MKKRAVCFLLFFILVFSVSLAALPAGADDDPTPQVDQLRTVAPNMFLRGLLVLVIHHFSGFDLIVALLKNMAK